MGARTDNGECGPGWHAAAQAFIGGQGRGPVLSAPMHGNRGTLISFALGDNGGSI